MKTAVLNHEAESWINDRRSADLKDESKGFFVKQAELVNVKQIAFHFTFQDIIEPLDVTLPPDVPSASLKPCQQYNEAINIFTNSRDK